MSLSRRYLYLLLLAVLVPAGVQAAVWIGEAIEERRTPPPVKAARAFLDSMRGDDCERTLSLLSAASRAAVEAEMEAQRRPSGTVTPRSCQTRAMRAFHGLYAHGARLASQDAGTATVRLDHYEADPKSFLLPGFWPTRYFVTPAEMRLVAEAGGWRVVVP